MRVLADNKKAYFNYEILEKIEAGIALIGQEVKSIKTGRINLAGSYVTLNNNELFLVGANIPPYQPKNAPADYSPERQRKLLLKKSGQVASTCKKLAKRISANLFKQPALAYA